MSGTIRETALAGTHAEVADRIEEYAQLGISGYLTGAPAVTAP